MNWSHTPYRPAGRRRALWPLAAAAPLALLPLSGCAANAPVGTENTEQSAPETPREVSQEVTLALVAQAQTPAGASVTLRFERKDNLDGPRAVEAFVHHSEHLKLASSQPGLAAQEAGKQVIVQEREPGMLRVIVYASTNLNTLDSGALAELEFERVTPGEAVVDFISDKVSLAPADAARGMTLSEPLILGGR